jgi:predicted CopG family antitoxin
MSVRVTKSQRSWLNAKLKASRGTKTFSELIRDLIEDARKR